MSTRGPSPSHQAHRRLKALEREGVISGYFARLDPSTLGRTFETLVFVTMRAADKETIDAFEQAVADIPHILEAQRLFGAPTTSSASSPTICPPSRSSTTSASPPWRVSNASAQPSS